MGLDIRYQAIPDDCELLELTREYQDDEWLFSFRLIPPPFVLEQYGKTELDFLAAQKKLREHHIGIEKRHFITRSWGVLLYMLSEKRRNQIEESDIWRRIIIGGGLLVDSGQIRFVGSSEVKIFATLLEKTYLERKYFDVKAMIEASVYKSMQFSQSEETFQFIEAEFEELKQIYYQAAEYNEGIITEIF